MEKVNEMECVELTLDLRDVARAKVVITENDYVRIVRCDGNEDFDILCHYFEDDVERTSYAEDMCEVLHMLDIPHELIDEKENQRL